MKVIVDAFGGDNSPTEVIKGCAWATEEFGYDILLVGNKETIIKVAKEENIILNKINIVDTDSIITMEDEASEVIKGKSDSSMAVGLKYLAEGKGDAFISAGNSGALIMGATFIVKRIKGIKRPAFAPIIPNDKGHFMLLDSGANLDCRPEVLYQFGLMGSIYMEKVLGINNARVGLVNVGTESHKGREIEKEANKLLKSSNMNFIGNVEAREIPRNGADVIVTDGFTGNVILKLYEGMATTLMGKIKKVFTTNIITKLAALLVMPQIKKLKKEIDYNEHGGAPVLGVRAPVYKAHGNANAKVIKNAIHAVAIYCKSNMIENIEASVIKNKGGLQHEFE